ncbi:alpha,alpha-trehalase [Synchytrium endobioticum]|uniref:Trehalase n=1 Tax=Synchytrium endobioticum TaxID=286115 RepID=A0A507DD64_9FUNG|nr:alpha,alpha-trehalase [Synchytrium endobioticum]
MDDTGSGSGTGNAAVPVPVPPPASVGRMTKEQYIQYTRQTASILNSKGDHLQPQPSTKTTSFELEREKDFPDADSRYSHGVSNAISADALKRGKSLSFKQYKVQEKRRPLIARTREEEDKATVTSREPDQEVVAPNIKHKRRHSHETNAVSSRQLFQIDVAATAANLLKQEDTNGDEQITVEDAGPKVFCLATESSNGFRQVPIRGAYQLANLLQELAIAQENDRKYITLSLERLNEPPVNRLARRIGENFWDSLTRRIDEQGLLYIGNDPKDRSPNPFPRIYVPYEDEFALQYYQKVAERYSKRDPPIPLQVIQLPEEITPDYVITLNDKPGLLALALRVTDKGTDREIVKGVPYVVPGGRFNEMYGWDSYFEALGLIVDERPKLAASMVENFCYEIEHYGKILNANRTYYLTRSQPPFLTDMALQTLTALEQYNAHEFDEAKTPSRLDKNVGLSKFHPDGKGIPPETESTHFDHLLEPYAHKHNLSIEEFIEKYNSGEVQEPTLDEYFLHDRAVRESGHDTTYRFEKICAHLATIDLNSLTYKYMVDLADTAKQHWSGWLTFNVRRGRDDVFWKKFNEWRDMMKSRGIDGSIGKDAELEKTADGHIRVTPDSWKGSGGEWDSSWAAGVMVMDEDTPFLIDAPADGVAGHHNSSSNNITNGCSSHNLSSSYGSSYSIRSQNGLSSVDDDNPLSWIRHHTSEDDNLKYFTVSLNYRMFEALAKRTKDLINLYLWNEEAGLYFDFDCHRGQVTTYESVTALYPMWAGLADTHQVDRMLPIVLSKFEVAGGFVAGTEASRGEVSLDRPNRQWDYPFGWAPHQILAWKALARYGYKDVAERLAYRWMYTVMRAFVDFNGVVVEKLDVVKLTHRVVAEYGNVGSDFKRVVREGFGWMNASVKVALHDYLSKSHVRFLNHLQPPEKVFFNIARKGQPPQIVSVADREEMLMHELGGVERLLSPEPRFSEPSSGDLFGSLAGSNSNAASAAVALPLINLLSAGNSDAVK